ncbi:hypothetical protein BGM19_26670 [Streptomyces agglomeratus]|nr:hypothetical protein BGM19_26670 [Streptomyces agglomeratus]
MAQNLEATDVLAAQDAINAALGTTDLARTRHYRRLTASVALRLSPESREVLVQRRTDAERVRRLCFLKTQLYDHPALVVLDQLEQRPGSLEPHQVADLQRLARSIKASDLWWHPMLEQWERVGRGFNDPENQNRAMHVLLEALTKLNDGPLPDSEPA